MEYERISAAIEDLGGLDSEFADAVHCTAATLADDSIGDAQWSLYSSWVNASRALDEAMPESAIIEALSS